VRRPGAPLTPPRGGRLLRIVGKASVKSREGPTTIKSWCSLLLDAHWFGIPLYPPPHANQRASHRGNPRNGSSRPQCGVCSERYPMSAFYIFACVPLIAALGYIGVSWAVAGAGLCVFATITVVLLCWSPAPMRHRPDAE
jgi:hypothetical protein